MVNPTKYDDFVQTGVNGTHTLFKCPVAGCVNPTVQVPRADPRQKSSRCFKHNSKYHSKSSNVVLPPTPTPSAPTQSMEPVATTLVINACCEESRRPLEDRIDAIREEQHSGTRVCVCVRVCAHHIHHRRHPTTCYDRWQ